MTPSSGAGAWLASALLLAGCAGAPAAPDAPAGGRDTLRSTVEVRALQDLRALAADSMEGRATGTEGSARARRFLVREFSEAGLEAFEGGYERPFPLARPGGALEAVNVVGYVPGRESEGAAMVVTAHYDHLGTREGTVYNGADDNASGVAALLAIARHLGEHPPRHTVVLAALDAEESGLRGAEALLDTPPLPPGRIALNVNLDMVGRNAEGELYAAGAYHYPVLRPILEGLAEEAPLELRLGHDSPDLPAGDDWTLLSDHGAFHRAGIPFVYFGVEDHPDYHRPTDDVERIEPEFYAAAVQTIIDAVELLDEALERLR